MKIAGICHDLPVNPSSLRGTSERSTIKRSMVSCLKALALPFVITEQNKPLTSGRQSFVARMGAYVRRIYVYIHIG